jgi:hypothetical protein
MDPELRAYLDENRRHCDAVVEQMTARVQLVAEGVTALADRVERVERNPREEILGARRDLAAMLRFSYAELERARPDPREVSRRGLTGTVIVKCAW